MVQSPDVLLFLTRSTIVVSICALHVALDLVVARSVDLLYRRKKRGSCGWISQTDLLLLFFVGLDNLGDGEVAKAVGKAIESFSEGLLAFGGRFLAGHNRAPRLDKSVVDVLPADGLVLVGVALGWAACGACS